MCSKSTGERRGCRTAKRARGSATTVDAAPRAAAAARRRQLQPEKHHQHGSASALQAALEQGLQAEPPQPGPGRRTWTRGTEQSRVKRRQREHQHKRRAMAAPLPPRSAAAAVTRGGGDTSPPARARARTAPQADQLPDARGGRGARQPTATGALSGLLTSERAGPQCKQLAVRRRQEANKHAAEPSPRRVPHAPTQARSGTDHCGAARPEACARLQCVAVP